MKPHATKPGRPTRRGQAAFMRYWFTRTHIVEYIKTKQRLLEEEDVQQQLRGFTIPAAIVFQPREPESDDELRVYLQNAIALATHKSSSEPLHSDSDCSPGNFGRFVCLVDRDLREQRWLGDEYERDDVVPIHEDLKQIVRVCTKLETLVLDKTMLKSCVSITHFGLQELTLINTPVSMRPVVELFNLLGDKSVRMASTLQRFTYHDYEACLSQKAVDAIIRMLEKTNSILHKLTLYMRGEYLPVPVTEEQSSDQAVERRRLISLTSTAKTVRFLRFVQREFKS